MVNVTIIDKGCRGCTLCVDTCPVNVFDYDAGKDLAKVARQEDCIGCLSCYYECPSQCIEVSDIERMRPFHRIEEHAALIEKFLQEKAAGRAIKAEDLEEARKDVSARLVALTNTIVEVLGTGYKAVGRRAGALAAAHLPEVYEEKGLDYVLGGMQRLFHQAFQFDFKVSGEAVSMEFHPCGLCRIVEQAGWKVGEAVLCQVFHEFWAGLLTAYIGTSYRYELPMIGATCKMELQPVKR
ncbi:MAG TPA: ferredoxin family protein [Thermodesulfovibrionales bacterium]|nr:ferredoxin family protein [Thermodesulfovibrionales bacterium]